MDSFVELYDSFGFEGSLFKKRKLFLQILKILV